MLTGLVVNIFQAPTIRSEPNQQPGTSNQQLSYPLSF